MFVPSTASRRNGPGKEKEIPASTSTTATSSATPIHGGPTASRTQLPALRIEANIGRNIVPGKT